MSLILYASPLGAIAEACHNLWDDFEAAGVATTAQTYPSHVTLTGFFDVSRHRIADLRAQTEAWIKTLPRQRPTRLAPVVERQEGPDWIGFRVESEVFEDLARGFADAIAPIAVRLKTELHLSLAYGQRINATQRTLIDKHFKDVPLRTRNWEIALWERDDAHAWSRLASTTLSFG